MKKLYCDTCKDDITENREEIIKYRLTVTCDETIPIGGYIADKYVHPPIPCELHFCSLKCLIKWCEARKNVT